MSSAAAGSFDIKSLTTSSGQSDACQNPFCKSIIEALPDGWRRTKRRYCSNPCKLDGVLRRCSTKWASYDFTSYWIRHDRSGREIYLL
jgi:hypothetical protein